METNDEEEEVQDWQRVCHGTLNALKVQVHLISDCSLLLARPCFFDRVCLPLFLGG